MTSWTRSKISFSVCFEYNPLRDPVQVRGSILHNLKQLPSGKWTWKYDKRFRQPGGRRFQQDPEMTERLWGYMESLACPTLVVRGSQSDIIALGYRGRNAQAYSQRQDWQQWRTLATW